MQLETALVSYAGLTCWALSTNRMRRELGFRRPAKGNMRVFGAALGGLAAWLAALRFGPQQGAVAWVGMLSLAGLALVLLLSQWPRFAVGMAAPSLILAVLMLATTNG